MLAVEPTRAVANAEQAEADVVALQSIDLRILLYLASLEPGDGWRSCAEVAGALGVSIMAIAWRPFGRLEALELIHADGRIPLYGGRKVWRATERGERAAALIRNPSAASAVTREWLQFLDIPTELPTVA